MEFINVRRFVILGIVVNARLNVKFSVIVDQKLKKLIVELRHSNVINHVRSYWIVEIIIVRVRSVMRNVIHAKRSQN